MSITQPPVATPGIRRRMPGALTLEEQMRVRQVLTDLYKRIPNQTELAKKLGVSQQHVSLVLKGGPIGHHFARRIADLTGKTLDTLLRGEGGVATSGGIRLKAVPQWEDVMREVRTMFPHLPEQLLADVSELVVPRHPEGLHPTVIANLAFQLEQLFHNEETRKQLQDAAAIYDQIMLIDDYHRLAEAIVKSRQNVLAAVAQKEHEEAVGRMQEEMKQLQRRAAPLMDILSDLAEREERWLTVPLKIDETMEQAGDQANQLASEIHDAIEKWQKEIPGLKEGVERKRRPRAEQHRPQ